jgi:hypothetical protein
MNKVIYKIIIADQRRVVIVAQLAITFNDIQHHVNHVKKMNILI